MESPMKVSGPEEFAKAMRYLALHAPGELDDVMVKAGQAVLPAVHARGGGGTTVTKVPGRGAAFKNPKKYAWAQHGAFQPVAANSQTWWAESRVGRSQSKRVVAQKGLKGIPRKRFVSGAMEAEQVLVNASLADGINRLLAKHIKT